MREGLRIIETSLNAKSVSASLNLDFQSEPDQKAVPPSNRIGAIGSNIWLMNEDRTTKVGTEEFHRAIWNTLLQFEPDGLTYREIWSRMPHNVEISIKVIRVVLGAMQERGLVSINRGRWHAVIADSAGPK